METLNQNKIQNPEPNKNMEGNLKEFLISIEIMEEKLRFIKNKVVDMLLLEKNKNTIIQNSKPVTEKANDLSLKKITENPKLLTIKDVSRIYGWSIRTIHNYKNAELLPYKIFKKRIYFSQNEIDNCFQKIGYKK